MTQLPPILNVGCGPTHLENSIGVDFDPQSQAEVMHDLDLYPWPFEDCSFERIICRHVLEHLHNPQRAMGEIHRLARPNAIVEIATPHYSSPDSWGDMTHYMHFSLKTFEPFYRGREGRPPPFSLVSRRLTFGKGLPSLTGRAVAALLGLGFYEKYASFVFRAANMEFVLRANQPPEG